MNSDFGYLNSQVPDEVAIPMIHRNATAGTNTSNGGKTNTDDSVIEQGKMGIEGICK